MRNIPGVPGRHNGLIKIILLLAIAAAVVVVLAKMGIISLPFELPF
ncbi:hypothetical protein HYU18_02025 [Candidatus Woesearchaeota archaeon]|nr:hypothetical protein [Candidatus Woesearchaeota archaeon]